MISWAAGASARSDASSAGRLCASLRAGTTIETRVRSPDEGAAGAAAGPGAKARRRRSDQARNPAAQTTTGSEAATTERKLMSGPEGAQGVGDARIAELIEAPPAQHHDAVADEDEDVAPHLDAVGLVRDVAPPVEGLVDEAVHERHHREDHRRDGPERSRAG